MKKSALNKTECKINIKFHLIAFELYLAGKMAHRIIFYPVGNGDTSQIILKNGKRILMDYRHQKKSENGAGPEINLKAHLEQELKDAGRDYFDVVAFTHGDKDHIENSIEFFELLHAAKYQGEGRIKINTRVGRESCEILEKAA